MINCSRKRPHVPDLPFCFLVFNRAFFIIKLAALLATAENTEFWHLTYTFISKCSIFPPMFCWFYERKARKMNINSEELRKKIQELFPDRQYNLTNDTLEELCSDPNSKDFLKWFCSEVSKDNVLTEEEIRMWVNAIESILCLIITCFWMRNSSLVEV